jgi:16S rRNA (guanine966-N2)-methyltransferase
MASSKSRRRSHPAGESALRIIGGQWRSRKLRFAATEGLRPTTDRIRETLFNWLSPDIAGAHCADLYAGSGALGFEALSRGAAHCDFVDSSAAAVRQILQHLVALEAPDRGSAYNCPANDYLREARAQLDVVFIDPPFGRGLIQPSCEQLAMSGLLAPGGLVYIEFPAKEALTNLPPGWKIHREKIAGAVAYRLYIASPA